MLASATGARQALHDEIVSPRCPIQLRSPDSSLLRRRIAVWSTITRLPARQVLETSSSAENFLHRLAGIDESRNLSSRVSAKSKVKRVFLLDVNPICYDGSRLDLHSFSRWLTLFFSEVSLTDPVIAVFDGENGNDYRKRLLPSYKAHRRKFLGTGPQWAELQVSEFLRNCHVPVVKVNGYEADDTVATLADQALQKGFRVVIASPDKDFKQLISENLQIVMPVPELRRWSFYTLKHYAAQYDCDPRSDLSLRCILGDQVDGVPGIQQFVPGFGRKTAVKLLKKHGSLENLLNTAAVRTVGKQFAQDALNKYADYLRRNYKVLSLRRDANVHLQEEWLCERQIIDDSTAVSDFLKQLGTLQQRSKRYVPSA
ncbi:5'-3' exonuclease family protein [Wolffia australiana]